MSLMVGLRESLRLLQEEGLSAIFARHKNLAQACRAGLMAMGCELFAKAPAPGITAALPPSPVAADKLVKTLQESFNLTIVGGQDSVKDDLAASPTWVTSTGPICLRCWPRSNWRCGAWAIATPAPRLRRHRRCCLPKGWY